MGKNTNNKRQEMLMRIHRYLNHPSPQGIKFTVDGEEIESDTAFFCETAEEDIFEECIACIYDDDRYHKRIRFLGKRSKILDWILGPLEFRIYRHQWQYEDDTTRTYRMNYRNYLRKSFLYGNRNGKIHTIKNSHYNRARLEEILSEEQWQKLQILKHGPDHVPADNYETVIYDHVPSLEGVEAPPPQITEWLLRALRGSTFERNEVG